MISIENIIICVIVIFSIVLHEIAHGAVAFSFGDDTAKLAGRLSLNPLRHIDILGTIIIPLSMALAGVSAIFGYAKPVPVNFNNVKRGRFAIISIALAGPATNILIAIALLKASNQTNNILLSAAVSNIFIAVFNMVPLLPLDGGRIFAELLPRKYKKIFYKTEKYGMMIIFSLIIFQSIIERECFPNKEIRKITISVAQTIADLLFPR